MKNLRFVLLSFTALAATLRADSQHILRASFPDGTGLEIFTQTTGSSQVDPGGAMGVGPGIGSQDFVNRAVLDRADTILFAYNIEASRGASPDTVKVRILPLSVATEATMLQDKAPGHPHFSGAHIPTVAGVREFAAVKFGEAVTLDILYNPSTGEKVYDVLRPIASSSQGMGVTTQPAPETIALKEITIRVNGRIMPAPASFIIGSVVRVDIPRLGTYVVAANDPHEASRDHGFSANAHADGKTLSWAMGRDRVEITSSMNVLTRSGNGVLWVYHDAHYQPDVVGLQAADTVDWLFPKR